MEKLIDILESFDGRNAKDENELIAKFRNIEGDPKVHKTLRSPLFFYKYNNQIWMTTEN